MNHRFRISSTNPVRRRLFPSPDPKERASLDNYTNILQEEVTINNIHKSKKWNFDFVNEKPLEGIYEWTATDGDNWIGRHKTVIDGDEDLKLKTENLKTEESQQKCAINEKTPRTAKEAENVPVVKKRKRESSECRPDKSVRRSLSFD